MSRKKSLTPKYKPGTFSAIPHALLDHPDYLSLNWSSQSLLIHMIRFYNGYNNGDLSIVLKNIMEARGWSKGTLSYAKKELIKKKWIIQTRLGSKRICSLFALSWLPLDECKEFGRDKFDDGIKESYVIRSLRA